MRDGTINNYARTRLNWDSAGQNGIYDYFGVRARGGHFPQRI